MKGRRCRVILTFGAEFGLHVAMSMTRQDGRIGYDALRFGYVQEHGEVFGIVEAQMSAERVDMIPVSNRIWAKDVRGREYESSAPRSPVRPGTSSSRPTSASTP